MKTPSLESVKRAQQSIAPFIHRTPVYRSQTLNERIGVNLCFKCECFQKVGAFKARGAINALLNLPKDVTDVVTHSSGNHGAALAWAAMLLGKTAYVICPYDASPLKRAAIERYGGKLIDCGSEIANREATLREFQEANDAVFVAPYDDFHIISGQGTAALEFIEDEPHLDQIWVPIGGGGLASGTILAANLTIDVLAGEPELARDAFDSLRLGEIQPAMVPVTVADGLRSSIGELTFEILRQNRTRIVLVSEDEIVSAMRMVWQHLKIVIEPSSAVPLAAIIQQPTLTRGLVGVILSGGNATFG